MAWLAKADWVANPRNPAYLDLDNIVKDQGRAGVSSWGGDVDAGANALRNLKSVCLNPATLPGSGIVAGELRIDASYHAWIWNGSAFIPATSASAGLGDPGSNGLVKRTALNSTAPAVAGTDYQAALGFTAENAAHRNAANGYAPLDAGSLLPLANLPGHGSTHTSIGSDAIPAATAAIRGTVTTTTATTQVVSTDDTRMTNARTPSAHASTHVGGSDPIAAFTGDSGSGGTLGLVPAPPSGATAAGRFLKADGTWSTPSGTGSGGSAPGGTNGQLQFNNFGTLGGGDLAGDVTTTGTLTATVTGLQGRSLFPGVPTDGQVIAWSTANNRWQPTAAATGTPAGSSGQIQYNNGGSFGGAAVYVASGSLGIGIAAPEALLDLGAPLNIRGACLYRDGGTGWGLETNNNLTGLAGTAFLSSVAYGPAGIFAWRSKAYANRDTLSNIGSFLMTLTNAGYLGVGLGNTSPTATHLFQLGADDAYKPATNFWNATSDIRTKRKIAPFADGLAAVRKINPISYEYNGLAGTPDNGASNIGVSAQDVRVHLPYCVKSHRAKLHKTDADETDLLSFNPQGLFYAMLNAIKELDARLTEAGH